jgi:hypothetical protein
MYPDCARRATLYEGLRRIDEDLATTARDAGCPDCGGPLDWARWMRKPRGCEVDLPEEVRMRHGLCCRHCRGRVLPPSTIFLGRKVYLGAVVLLSIASRQRQLTTSTAKALRAMFGVSAQTLARWMTFWAVEFPTSTLWKRLRGRVSAAVRDDALPNALLDQFDRRLGGPSERAATACMTFMAGAPIQAS